MTEKIITPQSIMEENLKEYIWLVGKALEQEAIRVAKQEKCDRCGRKDKLRIVPLHELPHPLPTKIVLYCDACKFNKILMSQDTNKKMKHFMEEFNKKAESILPPESRDSDRIIHDKELTDKLISNKKTKK